MRPPSTELLIEALAEALQTTAFISPEPAGDSVPTPAGVVHLSIRWLGNPAGEMELAAPLRFGEILASNTMAVEPGDLQAMQGALDALQELCNITTGALLSRLCDSPDDAPEMSLPRAVALAEAGDWDRFLSRPGTVVLLGEGYPLAVRARELQL